MEIFDFAGKQYSASAMANWAMASISLTLTTNIIGTALVIIHIMRVTGVGSRTYAGIIEILVESSFLYSATQLVFLALYVHDVYVPYLSDTHYYPEAMLGAVTVSHYRSIGLYTHFILFSVLPLPRSLHMSHLGRLVPTTHGETAHTLVITLALCNPPSTSNLLHTQPLLAMQKCRTPMDLTLTVSDLLRSSRNLAESNLSKIMASPSE